MRRLPRQSFMPRSNPPSWLLTVRARQYHNITVIVMIAVMLINNNDNNDADDDDDEDSLFGINSSGWLDCGDEFSQVKTETKQSGNMHQQQNISKSYSDTSKLHFYLVSVWIHKDTALQMKNMQCTDLEKPMKNVSGVRKISRKATKI